jgi:hypothetical protein
MACRLLNGLRLTLLTWLVLRGNLRLEQRENV